MKKVTVHDLEESYQTLLFDAFGVLVNDHGVLPGAAAMIDRLNRNNKSYFVLTNDASKSISTCASRYQSWGLNIEAERFITSGSLLQDYFSEHGLAGARCLVLGTEDSKEYVRIAGGELLPLQKGIDADAVIIGNQTGFDFLHGVNLALNAVIQRIESNRPISLLLPNPDMVYPANGNTLAIASGSVALMLEESLAARFLGMETPKFIKLGKPYPQMFRKAAKTAETMNMVMIGDQLATDIKGANDFGIASALVAFGLNDPSSVGRPGLPMPNYLICSF